MAADEDDVEPEDSEDLSGGSAGADVSKLNHDGFGIVLGGVLTGLGVLLTVPPGDGFGRVFGGDFWPLGMMETVSLMKVGELDWRMTCPVTTSRSAAEPPREESLEESRDESPSASPTLPFDGKISADKSSSTGRRCFMGGLEFSSGRVSITSSSSMSVTRVVIFVAVALGTRSDLPFTEKDDVVVVVTVVVEVSGEVEVKKRSLALILDDGRGENLGCTGGEAAKKRSFALTLQVGLGGVVVVASVGDDCGRGMREDVAVCVTFCVTVVTGAAMTAFLWCSACRFSTCPDT